MKIAAIPQVKIKDRIFSNHPLSLPFFLQEKHSSRRNRTQKSALHVCYCEVRWHSIRYDRDYFCCVMFLTATFGVFLIFERPRGLTHIASMQCDKIQHCFVLCWLQERNLILKWTSFIALHAVNMSNPSCELESFSLSCRTKQSASSMMYVFKY